MQDGLSAPPGSPNHRNFWQKKLNKKMSKYVLDVLFKDPFHFCPPAKHKSVQVVDFLFFTDEFYLRAKANPNLCTTYRPSGYV